MVLAVAPCPYQPGIKGLTPEPLAAAGSQPIGDNKGPGDKSSSWKEQGVGIGR